MIEFAEFPMPPSDNRIHGISKRGLRYTSKEYQAFKYMVQAWELANRAAIADCIKDLKAPIAVHFDLHFEKSKLLTKDGRTKKIDASNRIKGLCDALSNLIHIDDSEFWTVSVTKIVSTSTFVNITIREF